MTDKNQSKVVLITGCSSGFGLFISARLSAKGYKVYATMRNTAKQAALLSEVNRRNGAVEVLALDVTDKESINKAIRTIANKEGYIDVLVNNAGYGIGGSFEDLTEEEIRLQMETNFFGVQNVIREVIPFMRQRKKGKIINISSVAGFSANPFFGAYNASKFALEGFSESLRYELKPFGIDVILIQPGPYKTKIFSDNAMYARNYNNPSSPYYEWSHAVKKFIMSYVNDLKKDPEEIAELVEKLINKKHPKFRNIPDLESQVQYLLRKFLPFSLYSGIVNRIATKIK